LNGREKFSSTCNTSTFCSRHGFFPIDFPLRVFLKSLRRLLLRRAPPSPWEDGFAFSPVPSQIAFFLGQGPFYFHIICGDFFGPTKILLSAGTAFFATKTSLSTGIFRANRNFPGPSLSQLRNGPWNEFDLSAPFSLETPSEMSVVPV